MTESLTAVENHQGILTVRDQYGNRRVEFEGPYSEARPKLDAWWQQDTEESPRFVHIDRAPRPKPTEYRR